MATTTIGVNHPLAAKLWGTKLFEDVVGQTFWGKFSGTGSSNIIQVRSETSKGAGDRVTVGLRMLGQGLGIQGADTLEGNEEDLTLYNFNLFIDNLRHAFRTEAQISEQRVPWSLREECKGALADWWVERLETCLANQLCGNTGESDTRKTGNQACTAPTSANGVTRIIVGAGHGGEASLTASTTNAIKFADLDKCVAYAKTQSPRIRPVRVDGKEVYVAFLHPYAIYQLRQNDTANAGFYDVYKAVLQGGKVSDNPIINGANFVYNGIAVHEWNYLPTIAGTPATGTAADYRRGVFCGAQAACVAYGQKYSAGKMKWVEENFDYEGKFGVAAGLIFGIKKSVFNSIDYATIALSGYAPAP